MRDAGSSVGSCATITSQLPAVLFIGDASYTFANFRRNDAIRQGTRRPRAELSAAHPEDQEGAPRPAVGPGAQGAGDRPGLGQGFPDLREADRPRAAFPRRGRQGIHLLHEEEVSAKLRHIAITVADPEKAAAFY